MAQTFGKTWWGQQWLNSLKNIDYGNRIPRGSTYARNGSVKKIELVDNQIFAKVQGSRPKPYNIAIVLPPFTDLQRRSFMEQLALRPVIISKLLNRELDPEVLAIAERLGLKVFPRQWSDLKMQCSCPDSAVPCKHLAAVIFKTSVEIDNNPFVIFELHGMDLLAEMNKLGNFVSKDNVAISTLESLYFDKNVKKAKKPVFNAENAYQKLAYSTIPSVHEPLLTLLSDNPVFYTEKTDFKEKYRVNLGYAIKNAQKLLQGKLEMDDLIRHFRTASPLAIDKHTRIEIRIDTDHQPKALFNNHAFIFYQLLTPLSQIPANKIPDYQPSVAALHTYFQLALHLISNGAVVPQILQLSDKQYLIRWLPAMLNKEVRTLIEKVEHITPPDIFVWQDKTNEKGISKNLSLNLLSVFITDLISVLVDKIPDDLYINLFFKRKRYDFRKPGEEALSGGIQAWLQKYYLSSGNYKLQLVVEETNGDRFRVSINVDSTDKLWDGAVSLHQILTLKKFDKHRFEILQGITQLSPFIKGLDAYINSQGEQPILMENEVFTPFLLKMIPVIELLAIDILLPKSLKELLKPKVSLQLKAKKGRSFLRLDQLLDFDWQVAIGDTFMSQEEFKKLLKKSDTLIKYKSQYVYAGKEDLEKLYKHFNADKELSAFELLRVALSGEYYGAKISLTDEVSALIKELSEVKEVPLPKHINANLRPYQERGFAWMYRNAQIGFGSVIADDMGLGKTLQVITTLLKYKEEGLLDGKKVLVVAPTGLLTNWQAEIEKFAPMLKVQVFHGTNRKIGENFDILLTSYGIARTEATLLKKQSWHSLVIDEAQHIKNQDTAQAKAIKSIGADSFIAMSGTPIENRLSEFWSIIDFSNRGLLGNQKEFQETYGMPIEVYNDTDVAETLKKVTAPFMMRRLKTDKTIISDLPDKIEIDSFATLAREQASLYEKTVEEAMKEIEMIDDSDKKGLFVRQGLVLQMILALKQICNHPAQFLKNKQWDSSQSGKLALLFDKLDSIVESNEKVLIFSQFTEMGKMLRHFIEERYAERPLFYHGGNTIKERKEMVEAFQTNHADKIFVLSLKAAGTGLNLTAANHVIHYDLWWNPAVEAQATDRAYRIGQKSNVMVHRLITKNTFEERINEMIQAKKALADMTVATGESWIGNLSNKEIKDLFKMNG
ncbi:DEAD/DEAH box helicase [Emticicia agri]|uniref:Helicase SNF2 n=1 Tax=Emticicia agri TaxID=2492393 RepID=A0A4V1ZDR7_9BACT|nr:DEAD/DEAH box helicase [Emticicia agri]RYU97100.1 helicase SNF2 [Emticicia agri]